MTRLAENGVEWIGVPGWERMGWLRHGFSTRRGGASRVYCPEGAPGELNLGFTAADDREAVVENRARLVEAISGDRGFPLVTMRQIHSSVLATTGAVDSGRERPCKGDGLMTDEPGVLLGVQTADCIPVLVADRKRRAVAAFHAGWRGTVKRIVEGGIGRMRLEFGSRPEDLVAAIGPGIGPCCYAVGEEVISSFESQFTYGLKLFREAGAGLSLDLIDANRRQLLDAGVKARSIKLAGGCTSCHAELFFSHRASGGHTGRMMSVIGIRGL